MPFDLSTIRGYACGLTFQVVLSSAYFTIFVPIGSIFLTMGLFMGAFHSHYQHLLGEIQELVDMDRSGSESRIQLKSRLVEAINLHNRAKA